MYLTLSLQNDNIILCYAIVKQKYNPGNIISVFGGKALGTASILKLNFTSVKINTVEIQFLSLLLTGPLWLVAAMLDSASLVGFRAGGPCPHLSCPALPSRGTQN